MLCMFVLTWPIGSLAGMMFEEEFAGALRTLSNAATIGALLYIGMVEIISEEFANHCSGLPLKAVVFVLGALATWVPSWIYLAADDDDKVLQSRSLVDYCEKAKNLCRSG